MFRQRCSLNIAILLIVLLVTTVMVTSFHHHVDFRVHPDCIICKVANDLAANDTPLQFHILLPEPVDGQFDHEIVSTYSPSFSIPQNPRAPPTTIPV